MHFSLSFIGCLKDKMTNTSNKAASEPTKECCMCGDLGLFSQLFRCKTCRFRFQHKYCSNEYPTAEVYRICNWCLSEKDDSGSGEKTPNSSSSNKTVTKEEDDRSKKKINAGHGSLKSDKKALKVQINQPAIMKKRLPDQSPVLAARKRLTTIKGGGGGGGGDMQDRLRRTKSEDITNRGIVRKQIFRNKVKRYKLLHEVSC